jgi:hypothetical protein
MQWGPGNAVKARDSYQGLQPPDRLVFWAPLHREDLQSYKIRFVVRYVFRPASVRLLQDTKRSNQRDNGIVQGSAQTTESRGKGIMSEVQVANGFNEPVHIAIRDNLPRLQSTEVLAWQIYLALIGNVVAGQEERLARRSFNLAIAFQEETRRQRDGK